MSEQLVVEVDGVKAPNFELLEEKYNNTIATKIKAEVEHCNKEKWGWKLEVIYESQYFAKVALVTRGYSYLYEFHKNTKELTNECFIGAYDCKELSKLMCSFN